MVELRATNRDFSERLKDKLMMAKTPPSMASTPTIGAATTSATLSSTYAWDNSNMTLLGARWVQDGANPRAKPVTVDYKGDNTSLFANSGTIYFESDAPIVEIDGLFDYYRVYVDECDGNGWQLAGSITSAGTGTRYYVPIDWSAAGTPRRWRKYRIHCGGSTKFYNVRLAAVDTFGKYQRANPIKAVLVGDSFVEGSGGTSSGLDGYGVQLGIILEIDDFRCSGSGSTGLLDVNGANVKYRDRLTPDVINVAPDLVFIQLSQNDNPETVVALQAELTALIAAIRSGLPNARIIIIGVWNTTGTSATASARNTGLATTAASLNVAYIDWYSYITGTGRVGATTGDGNADFYVSTDSTHPSDAGHLYRAKRLASDIRAVLESTGWY